MQATSIGLPVDQVRNAKVSNAHHARGLVATEHALGLGRDVTYVVTGGVVASAAVGSDTVVVLLGLGALCLGQAMEVASATWWKMSEHVLEIHHVSLPRPVR